MNWISFSWDIVWVNTMDIVVNWSDILKVLESWHHWHFEFEVSTVCSLDSTNLGTTNTSSDLEELSWLGLSVEGLRRGSSLHVKVVVLVVVCRGYGHAHLYF